MWIKPPSRVRAPAPQRVVAPENKVITTFITARGRPPRPFLAFHYDEMGFMVVDRRSAEGSALRVRDQLAARTMQPLCHTSPRPPASVETASSTALANPPIRPSWRSAVAAQADCPAADENTDRESASRRPSHPGRAEIPDDTGRQTTTCTASYQTTTVRLRALDNPEHPATSTARDLAEGRLLTAEHDLQKDVALASLMAYRSIMTTSSAHHRGAPSRGGLVAGLKRGWRRETFSLRGSASVGSAT